MNDDRPEPTMNRRGQQRLCCAGWCLAAALAMQAMADPAWGQQRYSLEKGRWEKQTEYDPATPEGGLQAVRVALASDRAEEAFELARLWIEQNPDHPMMPEAILLRGDSLVGQSEYFKSLFDYENVIRQFPDSPQFAVALQREYQVAKLFTSGVKRRFLGMRILSAAGEAEEIFIRIQERSPGSDLGEMASLALGDFYYDRAQMSSAAEAYDLFLLNYPDSIYTERAMVQLIYASLATFKSPLFDPTGLIEAAQRIKMLRQQFPTAADRIGSDALLVRIEQSLALKMLYTAQWYERRHERVSAEYTYQRVIKDYPTTAAARSSILRLTELGAPAVTVSQPAGAVGPDRGFGEAREPGGAH